MPLPEWVEEVARTDAAASIPSRSRQRHRVDGDVAVRISRIVGPNRYAR